MLRSNRGLLLIGTLILISVLLVAAVRGQSAGYSLRFYGNGTGDIDRVKIPVDPPTSADIGDNFTIEFFIRVNASENRSGACTTGEAGWTNGNIILDRDIFGSGDNGDYGISLFGQNRVIAFGVTRNTSGATICGTRNVVDGNWHHIAVTRNSSTGVLTLYVDGALDGMANGPTDDISYRDRRATSWRNDPFLVIGAEKHDYSRDYPSYSGWFDELRISTNIRYTAAFTLPAQPFVRDANTALLYHFDEGLGNQIMDSSGNGTNGVRRPGGNPAGPEWSTERPFGTSPSTLTPMTLTLTPTLISSRTPTMTSSPAPAVTSSPSLTPTRTPTITFSPSSTPAGGFPANGVRDNFNRADGPLTTANWSGSVSGFSIISNRLDVGVAQDLYWNTVFGSNQEAYITLTRIDPNATEIDLFLKQQGRTWQDGVLVIFYQPSSNRVQVWTFDPSNNWVQYGTDIPATFAAGDRFGARARLNGLVEVYRNSTLLGSVSVLGWQFGTSGGRIGLWMIDAPNTILEDFGGGNF